MFRILQRKGRARVFGYVLPLTAELKVREWHAYRAYYCGLCKELKCEYGFLSRFLLNYDLVLPALLADGMAGTQARMCPAWPTRWKNGRCAKAPRALPWLRTRWC